MEKQTNLFKKWWFWLCIILIVCVVIGIAVYTISNKTVATNASLNKKVSLGKLTYYIDNTWEHQETKETNVIYEYYYPTNNTMLMIMFSTGNSYGDSSTIENLLDGYVSGMDLKDNDFISKSTKKINNYNCGVIRCYLNGYETIQYIVANNNECYIFSFYQKNKLNNKYIELTEDIIKNAEIITETEEEKTQREAEEKARKEKEEAERKAKAEQEKQDFISSCKTYTYEQIARNPDNFKGTNVKLTGEVIQVLYSSNSVDLRVNITKKGSYSTWYTDTIYVIYYPETGEDKILEDDIITIYGTSMGDYTYTSAVGSPVTLPLIAGKYITINK